MPSSGVSSTETHHFPTFVLRLILRLGQKAQTFIFRSVWYPPSFLLLLWTDEPRTILLSIVSFQTRRAPATNQDLPYPLPSRLCSTHVIAVPFCPTDARVYFLSNAAI